MIVYVIFFSVLLLACPIIIFTFVIDVDFLTKQFLFSCHVIYNNVKNTNRRRKIDSPRIPKSRKNQTKETKKKTRACDCVSSRLK